MYPDLLFEYWDTGGGKGKGPEWVIEELLPLGALCIFASRPNAGGTEFLLKMAGQIAVGKPFGGQTCHQGSVLWISAQKSRADMDPLLRALPLGDSEDPMLYLPSVQSAPGPTAIPLYLHFGRCLIDLQHGQEQILSVSAVFKPKVVVVDGLAACTQPTLLRQATRASQFMRFWRDKAVETSTTFVFTHGLSRYGGLLRVADQTELDSGAHFVLSLEGSTDREGRAIRRLDVSGARFSRAYNLRALESGEYEPVVGEEAPIGTVMDRILEIVGTVPMTAYEIARAGNLNLGSVQHLLKKLVVRGLLETGPKQAQAMTYVRVRRDDGGTILFSGRRTINL